jgi:hypothetical protein
LQLTVPCRKHGSWKADSTERPWAYLWSVTRLNDLRQAKGDNQNVQSVLTKAPNQDPVSSPMFQRYSCLTAPTRFHPSLDDSSQLVRKDSYKLAINRSYLSIAFFTASISDFSTHFSSNSPLATNALNSFSTISNHAHNSSLQIFICSTCPILF